MIINIIMRLSPGAKKYVDLGQVSNWMTTDIQSLNSGIMFRANMYILPTTFFIYLGLLWQR